TGNMAWTWVSFPLVVIAGCVLAYYLAGVSRGGGVKVNQVELVDIDAESGLTRGTSWSHVYSPDTRRFDLELNPPRLAEGAPSEALLSWQGLPGDAMGGMNVESSLRLFNQPYRIASPALPNSDASPRLDGLPIQIGSSKTLLGRWWSDAGPRRLDKLTLNRIAFRLEGSFGNPLEIELRDCILYYGGQAFVMERSLSPGQTVTIDELPAPRTLEWHLTRRRMESSDRSASGRRSDDQQVQTASRWDRSGGNVSRILEVMMLFDAAGGTTYTGLVHHYQDFVDLTPHLGLDRAILVGRAESPAAVLLRDGRPLTAEYDRRDTWYRFVLPVERVSGERGE
ncbi:MAG: hypothetical protein WEH44_02665, partial [Pirellulaceae bacterium]